MLARRRPRAHTRQWDHAGFDRQERRAARAAFDRATLSDRLRECLAIYALVARDPADEREGAARLLVDVLYLERKAGFVLPGVVNDALNEVVHATRDLAAKKRTCAYVAAAVMGEVELDRAEGAAAE